MARRGRQSQDDYFRVAMAILGESGPEALTIAELGMRLGVTKGSFYHHFISMAGFVEGLVGFWKAEHNDRLIALSDAELDPWARVQLLTQIAVDLPHEAEAAFRAWSRDNAVVATAQREIDAARERHLTASMLLLGLDRPRAKRTARMSMAILVGSQQLHHPVDRRELLAMYRDFDDRMLR